MSGAGAPEATVIDASGLRVVVVAGLWHTEVMDGLVAGALEFCEQARADVSLVRVSGSFELPIVAQAAARVGADAVVALGVVIRGGTPHFEYVCDATTTGLMRVALDTNVPVGFGLLTCDTEAQARDRAGLPGSRENKGREAAHAAVSTALALRALQ